MLSGKENQAVRVMSVMGDGVILLVAANQSRTAVEVDVTAFTKSNVARTLSGKLVSDTAAANAEASAAAGSPRGARRRSPLQPPPRDAAPRRGWPGRDPAALLLVGERRAQGPPPFYSVMASAISASASASSSSSALPCTTLSRPIVDTEASSASQLVIRNSTSVAE